MHDQNKRYILRNLNFGSITEVREREDGVVIFLKNETIKRKCNSVLSAASEYPFPGEEGG